MTSEALADLVEAGLSDVEISELLGVSSRTVQRWRKRAVLPSRWTPTPAAHGTDSRYRRGCRCKPCQAAHTVRQRTYRRSVAYGRWKGPQTP